MRNWKVPCITSMLTMLICVVTACSLLAAKRSMQPDSIALSRLCDDIVAADGDASAVSCDYPFWLFDAAGQPSELRSDRQITMDEAVKNSYQMKNIYLHDRFYGTVVLERNADLAYAAYTKKAASAIAFLVCVMLANLIFCMGYLYRTILKPFRRMQGFAADIANGNLDVPVVMDRKHAFGLFTESFDLMRTELKTARAHEQRAVKAKQELISQLSHDIKTPLTSIKTSAELLAAKSEDATVLQKTGIIIHKTSQIEGLITDLFTDTLSELGNLKINLTECESSELVAVIKAADYLERIQTLSMPDCVLRCDKARLEQVFGNLIVNSYKYADTAITVSTQFSEHYLELSFLDYGDGVDEEHLPHLCEQYYRAGSDQTIAGAGLGLYIANNLMERMGGKLKLFSPDGFEAVVMIPLA